MRPDEPGYAEALRRAAEGLRGVRRAIVVHHDDADGLAAGAIALRIAEAAGAEARAVCIEKMHPEIVRRIHAMDADAFIYADIGSSRADLVDAAAAEGQAIYILDHHDPAPTSRGNIIHLNPELFGYDGDSDVSGATAAYMLLRQLAPEGYRGIAWAAVVGSAEIPGEIRGLNLVPLRDAEEAGDVEVRASRGKGGGSRYYVKAIGEYWDRASTVYTALGSVGYYRGGPELAVRAVLERRLPSEEAEEFEEERARRFDELFSRVYRSGLNEMRNLQWMDDGGALRGLGTKVIGTFLSVLSHRRIVKQDKYLVGMMDFDPNIPGLGNIGGEWIKVSVRVPQGLQRMIEAGKYKPASRLLEEAASRVGGVAEGHTFASSGLVPKGERDELLRLMDELAPAGG